MKKLRKLRKRGRPLKDRRRHLLIAAAVDYRGKNDDQLFFLFRGCGLQLIQRTFQYLVGRGHGIAEKAVVHEETDIVHRNGKGYCRLAVELLTPNFHFTSLDDMKILIEATLKRLHPCTFHWLNINKFLNV